MSLSIQIRNYLRENGPTTARTLADDLVPHARYGANTVRNTLYKMPDTYICAWSRAEGGRRQHAAVWDVVRVPENATKPTTR